MSRISHLHQLPGHKQAENTLFMKRLCFKAERDRPSKIDCINHLSQYIPLYEALEKRIWCLGDANPALFEFFRKAPWAQRSSRLKEDVQAMKQALSRAEQQQLPAEYFILPAMQDMVKKINRADAVTLFAFLAVRNLGDVFGGQSLRIYQRDVFIGTELAAKFYCEISQETQSLSKHINEAPLTEEEVQKLYAAAGDFFQDHVCLLEEMEEERKKSVTATASHHSKGSRYVLYAVSAAAVALTAGAVYSQMTFRD